MFTVILIIKELAEDLYLHLNFNALNFQSHSPINRELVEDLHLAGSDRPAPAAGAPLLPGLSAGDAERCVAVWDFCSSFQELLDLPAPPSLEAMAAELTQGPPAGAAAGDGDQPPPDAAAAAPVLQPVLLALVKMLVGEAWEGAMSWWCQGVVRHKELVAPPLQLDTLTEVAKR